MQFNYRIIDRDDGDVMSSFYTRSAAVKYWLKCRRTGCDAELQKFVNGEWVKDRGF